MDNNMPSQIFNKLTHQLKIAVGRDSRLSSEPLLKKATEVFLSYGAEVHDYGLMSSNDYYFVIGKYGYDAGLMATASHNPPEYGGFKMALANQDYPDSIDFLSGQTLYQTLRSISPTPDKPAGKPVGQLISKDYKADHLGHIFSIIDKSKIKPL